MSVVGRIIRSGERYVLGSEEEYGELASRYLSYLSHHDILEASDWKLRYAPDYYNKEKLQAIGNQLHKAKKRIDSNTRTGRPSGVNERPVQASEAREANAGPHPDTVDVNKETLEQQEKLIESINDELLHPTEVKEPSGAQAVKKASELKSETPGTSTEGSEAAPEAQKAQTKPDDDIRTRKVGTTNAETKGQLKDETGNNAQTTGTGTETPGEGQPTDGTGGGTQTADAGTDAPKPGDKKKKDLQSGDEFNPLKYTEMARDKNLSSSVRQMYGRLGTMRANAQKVFNKGTDEQIKNELGRWGIEAKDGDKVADYMNKIDEMLKEKAESGPTIGDKFRAHHGVGLTGLGVVGVSTLDLANSRGQQSNAQLYSDPFA